MKHTKKMSFTRRAEKKGCCSPELCCTLLPSRSKQPCLPLLPVLPSCRCSWFWAKCSAAPQCPPPVLFPPSTLLWPERHSTRPLKTSHGTPAAMSTQDCDLLLKCRNISYVLFSVDRQNSTSWKRAFKASILALWPTFKSGMKSCKQNLRARYPFDSLFFFP